MRSLDPASDPPDILNPHGGPPYRVMSRAVMAARIREQSEHYSLTITKLSSLYALLTHSTPPGLAGMNLYILFIFVSKIYIKTPLASFQNKHAPGSSPASRTGRQCCYSCRAAGRPTKKAYYARYYVPLHCTTPSAAWRGKQCDRPGFAGLVRKGRLRPPRRRITGSGFSLLDLVLASASACAS